MKQFLLPERGQFYKANLHCHTTMSDGSMSPEDIKHAYQEKGYSIVAYTDHEILFPQNHLTDGSFLALNGVEHDIDEKERFDRTGKKCHFCCIALEPDNHYTPCPDESKYERFPGNMANLHLAKPEPGTERFPRAYTPEAINALMAEIKKYGFFITYNHPDWSLEEQDIYCQYQGMDAMEICNYGCIAMGYDDYNPKAYDALLRRGQKIYCLANDDNHNKPGRNWDSFGGWTMIKAEKLEYRTITKALENGHFYASQGPEIHELWIEDRTVHISCSPVVKITFTTAQRHRQVTFAPNGQTITQASFPLDSQDTYFRVTVEDHCGKPANTNAYFLDTIVH